MDATTTLESIGQGLLFGLQFVLLLVGGSSILFLLFCLGCAGSDCFATPKRRTRPSRSSVSGPHRASGLRLR
jgi:hypothetical protein